ncbi:MAG: hypothetical protein ACXVXG_09240 [Nocardioidaceae bacterium]
MPKVNGIKLEGVPADLLARVRAGDQKEILLAWSVVYDHEHAVLATTRDGLWLATRGRDHRVRWDDLVGTETPTGLLMQITTRVGTSLWVEFRSASDHRECTQVLSAADVEAGVLDELTATVGRLVERVDSLEAHLVRIVELLERIAHRDVPGG